MPAARKQKDRDPDAQALIDFFLSAVSDAPQSLLMLDYDGTLAPFRQHRDRAFPYPGIARLLREIGCTSRTRIVIVSGRDANEIVRLLDMEPRPEIWGLHGLQRLRPRGDAEVSPLDANTVQALGLAERWLLDQGLLKNADLKTGSIAVHWRGKRQLRANDIRRRVLLGWEDIAKQAGLNLLEFDAGVEIRPHRPNKGDAVRIILSEMKSEMKLDIPAIYFGDDRTDEHAFEALNARSAGRSLTVLVRPDWRPTAAQLWLRSPHQVRTLLRGWLKACPVNRLAVETGSQTIFSGSRNQGANA